MNRHAVVVGADADGLGIARSLGSAGIPVIVADVDERRPGLHSRYVRPFLLGALSGKALIEGLLRLRATLDSNPLLFLTTDRQVQFVSEHRDWIASAFCLRLPSRQCVSSLLHKRTFQQEAEKLGFLVPRAVSITSERDFAHLHDIRFPAVIKPANKDFFFDKKAARARKVKSPEEAEAECRKILPHAPDLIVQEWIEGRESNIYFCLQYRGEGGVTVCSFTGRKTRCWPPLTGSTASCTPAPEEEAELELQTTRFFDQTGFTGMCSMEFKRDYRNGAFYMIEPTVGRTDWQEEVATINGVNIPLAAYCYELGLPKPGIKKPPEDVTWMYPPSYWRSVLATCLRGSERLETREVKSPCWRFDDPAPLAYFLLEWIRKFPSVPRWRELILERIWLNSSSSAQTDDAAIPNQIPLDRPAVHTTSISPKL